MLRRGAQIFQEPSGRLLSIDACEVYHYLACELMPLGHNDRLMNQADTKQNKNEATDSVAIC